MQDCSYSHLKRSNRDFEVNLIKRGFLFFILFFYIKCIFSQIQNSVTVLSDPDFSGFILCYRIRSRVKKVNKP